MIAFLQHNLLVIVAIAWTVALIVTTVILIICRKMIVSVPKSPIRDMMKLMLTFIIASLISITMVSTQIAFLTPTKWYFSVIFLIVWVFSGFYLPFTALRRTYKKLTVTNKVN